MRIAPVRVEPAGGWIGGLRFRFGVGIEHDADGDADFGANAFLYSLSGAYQHVVSAVGLLPVPR
jgi:hypothetical protein